MSFFFWMAIGGLTVAVIALVQDMREANRRLDALEEHAAICFVKHAERVDDLEARLATLEPRTDLSVRQLRS